MLTLRFFDSKTGKQLSARNTELEPAIAATCILGEKTYTVDAVRYVFIGNEDYIRLDVTEQKESKD